MAAFLQGVASCIAGGSSNLPLPERVGWARGGAGGVMLTIILGTALACTSGQTGSPVADNDPERGPAPGYESPSRFRPDDPNGSGTDPSLGGEGGGIPIWALTRADDAALDGDLLLVPQQWASSGGDRHVEHGHPLMLFDVSSGTPTLTAELPLQGTVLQFDFSDGMALLALARVAPTLEALPDSPVADEQHVLVLLDVGDPTSPTVVSEFELPEPFWRFERQGDQIRVLSATTETQDWCDGTEGGGLLGGEIALANGALAPIHPSMTVLRQTGEGLEPIDKKRLPNVAAIRSFGPSWVAGSLGAYQEPQTLNWAIMTDDGSIREGMPLLSDAPYAGVFHARGYLGVVTEDRSMQLFDATEPAAPTLLATLTLPSSVNHFETLTEDAWLISGGGTGDGITSAAIVLLDNPNEPQVVPLTGVDRASVANAAQAAGRVIGFEAIDDGQRQSTLSLSLWDVTNPSAPALLSTLATDYSYRATDDTVRWRLDPEHQRLLYPHTDQVDDVYQHALAIITFSDDTLALTADPTLAGSALRANSGREHVYATDLDLLETVNVENGDVEEQLLVELDHPTVAASTTRGNTEARLLWRAPGRFDSGTLVIPESSLELTLGSDEPNVFPVDHLTDDLVLTEHYAAVLGMRAYGEECADGELPEPLLESCADQKPAISVFSTDSPPRLVETLTLDDAIPVASLPDDAQQRVRWQGHVPLTDDRLLLMASRVIRCHSREACDALGIQGSEGMASGGSGPCDVAGGCPDVEPQVIITFDGSESRQLFMVLDLAAAAGPSLSQPVEVTERYDFYGEGSTDLSHFFLMQSDGFGLPRAEALNDEGVASPTDIYGEPFIRHYLDRYTIEKGEVSPVDQINTPGKPLLLGTNQLVTVEPRYNDDATISALLHRSTLKSGGAYIEETIELAGAYRDAWQQDGRVFVLEGPQEFCTDGGNLLYEVMGDGDLQTGEALELPLDNWGFAWWKPGASSTEMTLVGGPYLWRGELIVSVPEPGQAPEVVAYGAWR